jgi:hypothetical protein
MSESHRHDETAVEKVRRVRDDLNREIEATTGKQLLDHVHGHRYTSPFLQRLASKATSKADASGTASASN